MAVTGASACAWTGIEADVCVRGGARIWARCSGLTGIVIDSTNERGGIAGLIAIVGASAPVSGK